MPLVSIDFHFVQTYNFIITCIDWGMQMTKYYTTDELVPGMVTAGEVRTKGGQLIVENGVSLTDRLISRIKFYAIPQVSVTEDPIPVTEKEEQTEVPTYVVKPESQAPSYSQKVVRSKEFPDFLFQSDRNLPHCSGRLCDLS